MMASMETGESEADTQGTMLDLTTTGESNIHNGN